MVGIIIEIGPDLAIGAREPPGPPHSPLVTARRPWRRQIFAMITTPYGY